MPYFDVISLFIMFIYILKSSLHIHNEFFVYVAYM